MKSIGKTGKYLLGQNLKIEIVITSRLNGFIQNYDNKQTIIKVKCRRQFLSVNAKKSMIDLVQFYSTFVH